MQRSQVIPAVDVLGDEAVRLERGDFDARRRCAPASPLELVARFAAAGARADPPRRPRRRARGAVRARSWCGAAVAAAATSRVQASGGVRSLADARGARSPPARRASCRHGRLRAGRARRLRRRARRRGSSSRSTCATAASPSPGGRSRPRSRPSEAAERCAAAGVARLLCTAVDRDGTLAGPDLELLARVVDAFGGPVLAAGGIADAGDLDAPGGGRRRGAVVGRALLEGRLPLALLRA